MILILRGNQRGLGIPAFACTPDLFPDLMPAALSRHDLAQWAAAREIVPRGHHAPA
jgi:hypothetical protein